jgi:hypothetical protein
MEIHFPTAYSEILQLSVFLTQNYFRYNKATVYRAIQTLYYVGADNTSLYFVKYQQQTKIFHIDGAVLGYVMVIVFAIGSMVHRFKPGRE